MTWYNTFLFLKSYPKLQLHMCESYSESLFYLIEIPINPFKLINYVIRTSN